MRYNVFRCQNNKISSLDLFRSFALKKHLIFGRGILMNLKAWRLLPKLGVEGSIVWMKHRELNIYFRSSCMCIFSYINLMLYSKFMWITIYIFQEWEIIFSLDNKTLRQLWT